MLPPIQGDHLAGDRRRVKKKADRAAEFVERYDNPAFDPAMEALPLSHFEPMLRRLMAAPKNSVYKAALPGE